MSFSVKNLQFKFILSNNATFEGTGNNTLTVSGGRARIKIQGSGMPAYPSADMEIYGLKLPDMLALQTIAFRPLGMQRNTVIVSADSGSGFSVVFSGQIITGGPDFDNVPEVPMKIQARVLGFESLNPATPTGYSGTTPVATIVQTIASKLGYPTIENNGVTAQLGNPYFSGTLADQLRDVVQQSGIDLYIEGNLIAICPKGIPRKQPGFTISPANGLVGWPKLDYQRGYVYVKAYYNAAFRFGGPLTVQGSQIVTANGVWNIGTISHDLNSLEPASRWFSDMLLYPPGSLPPVTS